MTPATSDTNDTSRARLAELVQLLASAILEYELSQQRKTGTGLRPGQDLNTWERVVIVRYRLNPVVKDVYEQPQHSEADR